MWFSRKRDASFDKVLEMLKIITVELAKHDSQIDNIHAKLRKKRIDVVEEPEAKTEKALYDDGFDEIRKINAEDGRNNKS